MRNALKVFSTALLAATTLVSPVLADDQVDRSTLTREQTTTQIAKDLAERERAVLRARELLAVSEDVKIICEHPDFTNEFYTEVHDLLKQGYTLTKEYTQMVDASYVGTGLKLYTNFNIVFTTDAVKGSPAEETGLFRSNIIAYHVKAVNGLSVSGRDIDDVRALIRANGAQSGGVVVTLAPMNGGRDIDRYFEHKLIPREVLVDCAHLRAPLEK